MSSRKATVSYLVMSIDFSCDTDDLMADTLQGVETSYNLLPSGSQGSVTCF